MPSRPLVATRSSYCATWLTKKKERASERASERVPTSTQHGMVPNYSSLLLLMPSEQSELDRTLFVRQYLFDVRASMVVVVDSVGVHQTSPLPSQNFLLLISSTWRTRLFGWISVTRRTQGTTLAYCVQPGSWHVVRHSARPSAVSERVAQSSFCIEKQQARGLSILTRRAQTAFQAREEPAVRERALRKNALQQCAAIPVLGTRHESQ